ncbi:Hypothetical protein R9X50_00018000 [Acrodontium crateriforme]|uniref:Uncharacterized protein n=1 Tax=Acrodontium crateriforme TaxID=150365 RepID=A0AAQ3R6L9_9PEZI|nr:Hypothetical protein R9X50_00018000 [Acrodontium crateriforme]
MATISIDTAAVLVALLNKNKVKLGMKEYKVMSELDGNKGPGGFDHLFRPIKARAKDIMEKLDDGASATPVVKSCVTDKSPGSAKRGKVDSTKTKGPAKGKAKKQEAFDDDDSDDDVEATPTKKIKIQKEVRPIDAVDEDDRRLFEDAWNL